MTVFKSYFKILKKSIGIIILYTVIFLSFGIIATSSSSSSGFVASKPDVVVNNNDNTKLTDSLVKYIEKNANVVVVDGNIDDALFYQIIDEVVTIKENYTNDLLDGKNVSLETRSLPTSGSASYFEMLVNKYINNLKVYIESGYTLEESISLTNDNLESNTEIVMSGNVTSDAESVKYYYNFSNYPSLAVIMFAVGTIMISFNNKNIKKRNLISPTSYRKINFQMFLGNIFVCFGIWAIYNLVPVILYKDTMLTLNGLLLIINSLVFFIMALSLGILIGNLISNKNVQNAVVNVIALGSSFLCGSFVSPEYLGDTVKTISTVLPSSWFIKNNDLIALTSNFDNEVVVSIVINMGVVLLFALIFYVLTNVVTKIKLQKN